MTERPGPDEVIELGAVTLRRYRDDDPPPEKGTGVGVIWRLVR